MVLIASGLGTGAGSALVFPVLNLEINERSEPANRGSAFGLYSVAFGAGVAIGSIGIAPFYARIGFELAMTIGVVAAVAAGIMAVLDPVMHHPPMGTHPAGARARGGAGSRPWPPQDALAGAPARVRRRWPSDLRHHGRARPPAPRPTRSPMTSTIAHRLRRHRAAPGSWR